MYTLYFLPGACSLATNFVLRELNQSFEMYDKNNISNFTDINSTGAIPVLKDGDLFIKEGVAILLHLLGKHQNKLLPSEGEARIVAIQNMLFANATMHPAYGKLFFIASNIKDGEAKNEAFTAAVETINSLWQVVEQNIGDSRFLGGDSYSVADVLLTVYSAWGPNFPVDIKIGEKAQRMIKAVNALPNFKQAILEEKKVSEAA